MSAPFLSSVLFTEPELGVEADEPEDTQESSGEFDPDDFPDWYKDKVADDDDDVDDGDHRGSGDEASGGRDLQRPYFCDLAVVQTLDRLAFGEVTVLAGDNGSGKSTLIEAIAVAAGFNPEGGSRNLMFSTFDTHSQLADYLTLRWNARPKWGWFLRAETFYGMATHITKDNDPQSGIAVMFPDLHNRSHGESFLALAESRFTGKGLYIFDEPEAALSIQGQMRLANIIDASVAKGSQFIISTHSPFLMGIPGATIVETAADEGLTHTTFDDLTSTALWRRFFAAPDDLHTKLRNPK